jgi:hypothetical protein
MNRKKITNHIIRQYLKIDELEFQTGFNIGVLAGPRQHTKFAWLCTLLEWTNITHHDLISHNLWPRPEIINNQDLNTMRMHERKLGGNDKQWGGNKVMTNTKEWASASAKTTMRSISTATTAERSIISYDITRTKHRFTKRTTF